MPTGPMRTVALPEIRRLLLEGKNVEAERLVNANFTCQGTGSGHGSGANVPFGCYQTLGNLRLKFGKAGSGPTLRCESGHRAWSADQEIEFSMDGNQETKWCIIHDGRPVVWQLDAGQDGAAPREYRLTSAEDVPARDPRTWKLEGSTDGKVWMLLDEHKDEPLFATRHETRSYQIASPATYRFFRFTFMPNPDVTHFQVAEIHLDGVTPNATARWRPQSIRRTLDLHTALATVVYKETGVRFTREYFVSAPDEVFVSRLTADKPGALSFAVTLDRPERFETTAPANNELLMTGTLDDGRGGRGVSYAARLRVLVRGGTVQSRRKHAGRGQLG